jgi:hypothetical protein
MKKNLLVFLPLFLSATLSFGQWLDTVRIQQTGLDGDVPVSTDDAEQINNEIDKLSANFNDTFWTNWASRSRGTCITSATSTSIST